jgi:hypothetical protein
VCSEVAKDRGLRERIQEERMFIVKKGEAPHCSLIFYSSYVGKSVQKQAGLPLDA